MVNSWYTLHQSINHKRSLYATFSFTFSYQPFSNLFHFFTKHLYNIAKPNGLSVPGQRAYSAKVCYLNHSWYTLHQFIDHKRSLYATFPFTISYQPLSYLIHFFTEHMYNIAKPMVLVCLIKGLILPRFALIIKAIA